MLTRLKLVGVTFDCKLRMDLCVQETVSQASWKLTTILRTRRFHEVTGLFQVHKSKTLSFVEHRTPAVHHAARNILAGIDAIQKRFLRECSLTEEDALVFFNLPPLGEECKVTVQYGWSVLPWLSLVFGASVQIEDTLVVGYRTSLGLDTFLLDRCGFPHWLGMPTFTVSDAPSSLRIATCWR